MIARFRPSYTYSDIFQALKLSLSKFPVEEKLAEKIRLMYQVKYVFFFNQARVALYVLLKSLGIKGGVISPAYNCIVVPEAVDYAGLTNHFCEINLESFNMEAQDVKKALKKDSKIVLLTHQFGIPAKTEEIKKLAQKRKLVLIEDAAAALGGTYKNKLLGIIGRAAIISFQDTKIITAVDGGALITNDDHLAKRIKAFHQKLKRRGSLRPFFKALAFRLFTEPTVYPLVFKLWTHKARGYDKRQEKIPPGHLFLWSKFQAALAYVQFDKLEENLKKREKIAKIYLEGLRKVKDLDLPRVEKDSLPAWVRFPIRVKKREKFFRYMSKNGIDLAWSFNYDCGEIFQKKRLPNSQEAKQTVVDLPIYPDLSLKETRRVTFLVKKYF